MQTGDLLACLDSDTRIIHMATDVSQDLSLESQLANGLAVSS